jgi:hypothetical protein
MDAARKAVCRFLEDNWDEIVQSSIMRSVRRWSEMTPEEVAERIVTAGRKYGPLDVRSIDTVAELEAEHLDIPAYVCFEMFQAELDGREGGR